MTPTGLVLPRREAGARWWVAALLFVGLFAAYWPALRGGMLWDDDAHVTRPELCSWHGLQRIWGDVGATQQYYPMLHTAFWLEHRAWGDHPTPYHVITLLWHGLAAWLVIRILRRLEVSGATLAGFLFAVHPLMVESVAWISEQKNTLAAVFYFASALAYLDFTAKRRGGSYVLAASLFLLALLTKSVTATLPAALLVITWWRNGRLDLRRDVLPLLPWLLIAACAGGFTAWVERNYIGAHGADFSLGFGSRLLLAGNAVIFYLGKLLWPADLTFIYPKWSIDPAHAAWYLAPGLLVTLFAGALWRARRSRGPLAGLLFFVGTLGPALGFVNVYPFLFSYVADHFAYLAVLGVLVPASAGLTWAANRIPGSIGRRALLAALVGGLGVLTWRDAGAYRDAVTLYRTTLARNPACWLAHFNLGVLEEKYPAKLSDAIAQYQATIRLNPTHWAAHHNLGSAWLKFPDRLPDAITELETALRLNPDFAEAHNNLGIALQRVPSRAGEALAHFQTAVRLRPDYVEAHVNLGTLLATLPGRGADAIAELSTAARLAPSDAAIWYSLANALARSSDGLSSAIDSYRTALKLRPDYNAARNNLASALARAGQLEQAIREYRTALGHDPQDAAIHANLANALARAPGRLAEAIDEYRTAVRLAPNDASVHFSLGVALSDVRAQWPEARRELERALELQPNFAEAHYCLAVVLLRLGAERELAVRQLESALQQNPEFLPARQLLARLR